MQCVIKCVAFPNVKISIGEEDTSELEKQIQYYFEKENFSKSKRVQFFKECFSNLNGAVSKTDNPLDEEDEQIYIHDDADRTELAIKTKIFIGEVFQKGWSEIFSTVGSENLGVKSLAGGKQKNKAKETISQYADFLPVQVGKRPLYCSEIYDIPNYIEKDDGRGKKGFYKERLIPLLAYYLLKKKKDTIYTTVDELALWMGLVTINYKKMSLEELSNINPKITIAMLNQFYYRCKPELESIIFRLLDVLQDDYTALNYRKNHCIYTEDGYVYTSSYEEDVIITRTQRKVLKEFNAKRILTIFQRRQSQRYYARVCELINKEHNFNWSRYRKQIQITIDAEALEEILTEYNFDDENIKSRQFEVAERFAGRIRKRTQNDYNRTNKKALDAKKAWVDEVLKTDSLIKECYYANIYTETDLIDKAPEAFHYYSNYLDIQNQIIALMIGVPVYENAEIPELSNWMDNI